MWYDVRAELGKSSKVWISNFCYVLRVLLYCQFLHGVFKAEKVLDVQTRGLFETRPFGIIRVHLYFKRMNGMSCLSLKHCLQLLRTYKVSTFLYYGDSRWKAFVPGFYFQDAAAPIEDVLLDEKYVVHSNDLKKGRQIFWEYCFRLLY